MIQLKDIQFRYRRRRKIFEHLNLELTSGNIYGLLGKNGAGKSTLLKMMAGLVFPHNGACLVSGFNTQDRNPNVLQELFFIPEEFALPPVSADKFIRYNSAFYPKFSREHFDNYLREFELTETTNLSMMSFGQKKKFLLAFGLAVNTSVLILDEPTNGLDIPSKSQFRKAVASAMSEEKLIIISTHQVRDLDNLIESIVIVDHGKIVFKRNVQEITEKLFFSEDLRHVPQQEVLFISEGGTRSGIRINTGADDSKVDLEILFNAVIQNSSKINQQFN